MRITVGYAILRLSVLVASLAAWMGRKGLQVAFNDDYEAAQTYDLP